MTHYIYSVYYADTPGRAHPTEISHKIHTKTGVISGMCFAVARLVLASPAAKVVVGSLNQLPTTANTSTAVESYRTNRDSPELPFSNMVIEYITPPPMPGLSTPHPSLCRFRAACQRAGS